MDLNTQSESSPKIGSKERRKASRNKWKASNPEKHKAAQKKYAEANKERLRLQREANKEKIGARSRAYYQANREYVLQKQRRNVLKHRYGLDEQSFLRMKAEQHNQCAICQTPFDALPPKHVHIDHCHTTGKVRGILCFNCNNGLGAFKDNLDLICGAKSYLERFQ